MFHALKKMTVRNRVGHLLVVAHLIVSICLFVGKPTVNREAANSSSNEGSLTASTLLAGRSFHYNYESVFFKTLLVLDAPGLFLGLLVATFSVWLIQLFFPFGAYDQSWLVALLLLIATSLQWLVVGYILKLIWPSVVLSDR